MTSTGLSLPIHSGIEKVESTVKGQLVMDKGAETRSNGPTVLVDFLLLESYLDNNITGRPLRAVLEP